MIYKLLKDSSGSICAIAIVGENISIPFAPANTDYQQFKQAINDDTAQLEDAEGNLMTPSEAKAYVETLP